MPSKARHIEVYILQAPPKSYTKRLFNDPTLLRHKLLEEANELAEAETPDHIAAEAVCLRPSHGFAEL